MSAHHVRGLTVDDDTRCTHYQTDRDIVAFKFECCEHYYPCFRCHQAVTDHGSIPWPDDRFDEPSVLCGVCETELTVPTYLEADHRCPSCDASFNPGCREHASRYFDVVD